MTRKNARKKDQSAAVVTNGETGLVLAQEFGVSRTTIGRVVNRAHYGLEHKL